MSDDDKNLRENRENLLEAYHFARETRDHADTLLWEVGAIVWSGQALLLGFVLEAISGPPSALILIVIAALLGGFMALFTDRVMGARNAVCHLMIEMMTDIERKLDLPIKPQQTLKEKYAPRFQRKWSFRLNLSFAVAWAAALLVAMYRLVHPFCPHGAPVHWPGAPF